MEEPQLDDDALIGDDEALETYERGDDAPMSSDDEEAAAAEEEQIVDMSVQGFFEHKDSVYIVAVDPSAPSHRVVSGGGDDMAYVWDMTTGSTLYRLSGHSDSIVSAGFSADGKYVATGAMDATVRVWKTDTGEFVTSLEAGDEVVWIQWHPVGHVLLAGTNDGSTWMWSLPTGNVMAVFSGPTGPVNTGMFLPPASGKQVAVAAEDGTFFVFDPKTSAVLLRLGPEDARFSPGDGEGWNCVASDPEGKVVVLGASSGVCKAVNLSNGNVLASFEAQAESVESIAWCDVFPILACASVDGTIAFYDTQTWRLRSTVRHDDAVVKVAFVKGSPILISASTDKSVRRWDVRTGALLDTYTGHLDIIVTMDITPDGRRIVTGSDDRTALVFGERGAQ